jgi:hypothetical protein
LNVGETGRFARRLRPRVAEHQPQQRAVDGGAAHGAPDVDVSRSQFRRVPLADLWNGRIADDLARRRRWLARIGDSEGVVDADDLALR